MILERLTVSGFRTFAAPYTFVPDARFTVLHAPNGTGKTTLLDALHYGLLERHFVTGEKVRERFESVGRELVPHIDIDFAVGDVRYRLMKRFLGGKSASLQRREDGRLVPFKEGAAADDFVRDLFYAEPPSKGALDAKKHLGFAHLLWSPTRANFDDVPDVAGDQIRSMLGSGAGAVTDGERCVQESVAQEYARFFTGGGALATGATSMNLPALEQLVVEARADVTRAREQYELSGTLARDYQDRQADAQRMHDKRTGLRDDIVKAKASATYYAELVQAAEAAARAENTAREAYERVSEASTKIAAFRKEQADVTGDSLLISAELDELGAAVGVAQQRVSAAQAAADDAGAQATNVQKRAEYVTLAETYLRARRESESITATIDAHEANAASLHDRRVAAAQLLAPGKMELEDLRAQSVELGKLEATIAASALALDIDADVDLILDVITAEKMGALTLKAGDSAQFAATDERIVIDIPGVGRIRARGADGAAKARKKAQPIAASLNAAWERYGTSSLPELAGRTERAADLARQIVDLERISADTLAGRSIDDLQSARAAADARIATAEAIEAGWRESPPNAPALRADFDRDLRASADIAQTANAVLQAELRVKADVDKAIADAKARLNTAQMVLGTIEVKLQNVESNGLDDVTRAQHLRQYAFDADAAGGKRADLEAKMATLGEDPHALVVRLELQERDTEKAFEDALVQAKVLFANLERQAQLGTYAKLNACEERLEQRQTALDGARAQAAAVKCLHNAFEQIRTTRLEAVVGPITRAATRYMNRIAGSPVGEVSIGEGLAPLGLVERVSQQLIRMESTLSSGEKEQIYLATRLALADVIAGTFGRQLFVVDDALTATDPNRLRRFIAILEELSQKQLQIIVTTADKSRYLGIAGAKHVDLAAELQGAQEPAA